MFIIIFTMLFFNAIFAAYEMALAAVPKSRLNALVKLNKKGAKDALFMKERMEASLAVVQVGITLVGAIAAATGGAGADEFFAPYLQEKLGVSLQTSEAIALVLVVIPLSAFTIVFGELVPKTFALTNQEFVCLKLSPVMKILSLIFRPVVYALESVVKALSLIGSKRVKKGSSFVDTHIHELRAAASLARTSKLISPREEKIVQSATELSERIVRNLMIPADQISMIPLSLSLSDALVRAHMDMHTRFPICEKEGDAQSIIGYINFKDIVFALHVNPTDPTLKGVVRPIKAVKENAKVSAVLEEMIQNNAHIAVVKNDYEKIIGLLTLEDLLEELVGEIQDEYDKLPTFVHPYLSGWIIGGGVPMNVVASTLGLVRNFTQGGDVHIPTLSKWCATQKSSELKLGETVEKEGFTVTVRKLRRKQLSEAFVKSNN